jgi:hypothetical protein
MKRSFKRSEMGEARHVYNDGGATSFLTVFIRLGQTGGHFLIIAA